MSLPGKKNAKVADHACKRLKVGGHCRRRCDDMSPAGEPPLADRTVVFVVQTRAGSHHVHRRMLGLVGATTFTDTGDFVVVGARRGLMAMRTAGDEVQTDIPSAGNQPLQGQQHNGDGFYQVAFHSNHPRRGRKPLRSHLFMVIGRCLLCKLDFPWLMVRNWCDRSLDGKEGDRSMFRTAAVEQKDVGSREWTSPRSSGERLQQSLPTRADGLGNRFVYVRLP
jgi:hypothetical protein